MIEYLTYCTVGFIHWKYHLWFNSQQKHNNEITVFSMTSSLSEECWPIRLYDIYSVTFNSRTLWCTGESMMDSMIARFPDPVAAKIKKPKWWSLHHHAWQYSCRRHVYWFALVSKHLHFHPVCLEDVAPALPSLAVLACSFQAGTLPNNCSWSVLLQVHHHRSSQFLSHLHCVLTHTWMLQIGKMTKRMLFNGRFSEMLVISTW